jgi:hypothetical protein
MTRFHMVGDFGPGEISGAWRPPSRVIIPEVERAIDTAWAMAAGRLGGHLFDGPLCRLDGWTVNQGRLMLELSPTSYRAFLGTNLINAKLADQHGDGILANALGLSSALVSTDGYLMFGRRSHRVAYYPGRVHTFAGSLEVTDPVDVFREVARELREELNMRPADVTSVRCIGMCEDVSIRQPELIFRVQTSRFRDEVEQLLDEQEHDEMWCVPATKEGVAKALSEPLLTPIARGAAALWGRSYWGDEWFNPVRDRLAAGQ